MGSLLEWFLPEMIVVRPADLLTFRLQFANMRLRNGYLEPLRGQLGAWRALIVLTFPPQNIAEEAFFQVANGYADPGGETTEQTPGPPPIQSRIAGPSRLVFEVPDGAEIPFTLEGLLAACGQLALRTAPGAGPDPLPFRPMATAVAFDSARRGTFGGLLVETQRRAFARGGRLSVLQTGLLPGVSRVDEPVLDVSLAEGPLHDGSLVEDPLSGVSLGHEPARPADDETALELPFRLLTSPHAGAAWAHSPAARFSPQTGRTELWHTRLGLRRLGGAVDEQDVMHRTIRALWARDAKFDPNKPKPGPGPGEDLDPFRMSLSPNDRHQLVHLTSNYKLTPAPEPVYVDRLELSALGATVDWRGAWAPHSGLSIEAWRHRGTVGRDHYVRVIYAGRLYPFGHRASLIKVTERRFHGDDADNTAYLRQRMYIVVREPEKVLGQSGFVSSSPDPESWDRQMPFERARIKTVVTPDLDPPAPILSAPTLAGTCFWPRVADADFRFAMVATDSAGRSFEFALPLLFVEKSHLDVKDVMDAIATIYNQGDVERRRVRLAGSRLAFAPSAQPDDTAYETNELDLSSRVPGKPQFDKAAWDKPRFVPVVERANVAAPALRQLAGVDQPFDVSYSTAFLKAGFGGPNTEAEAMLTLNGEVSVSFDGEAQRSGALVTPNLAVKTLSRSHGPMAVAPDATWDPAVAFKESAKLFGTIPLGEIIAAAGLDVAMPKFVDESLNGVEAVLIDLERLPRELRSAGITETQPLDDLDDAIGALQKDIETLLNGGAAAGLATHATELAGALDGLAEPVAGELVATEGLRRSLERRVKDIRDVVVAQTFADSVRDLANGLEMAQSPRARLEWQPKLQSSPVFQPNNEYGLTLSVEASAAREAGAERLSVRCSLVDFTLNLVGTPPFISLHFKRIEFAVEPDRKPDIDVEFGGIEFGGPLKFVETLRSIIPLDGFSDPPALEVTDEGIASSFSVGLPDLSIGVFALQNLSVGAGFAVPFAGDDPMSVKFNFCEREHPSSLTVMCFGGGFFFGVTVSPEGLVLLEAAIEFGASLSIDFGVASGGVEIKAGIYFKLENDQATLTGYLRIRGEVDVLGLISASIEMRMELSHKGNKCVGRAVIVVEVEVLCFSASVSIETERKFAGSASDPTFEQQLPPGAWAEYCGAFA